MNSEIQSEIVLPPQPPTTEQEINIENTIHTNTTNITRTPFDIKTITRNQVTRNVLYTDGTFIPGQFTYVKNTSVREMFATAWKAINMTEGWYFMAQPIETFMWSDDPQLNIINNKIREFYDGHSGFTHGYTMRQMQHIAQNGEINFKKMNKD